MKTCFKCGITKERSDFYRHPQMADGLLGKCKECAKRDVRIDRATSPNAREYDAKRSKDPGRRKYSREHKPKRTPIRQRAHNAVQRAVRSGKLIKPSECNRCGTDQVRIVGHHADYNKPLDVEWLCDLCHLRHHASKGEQ